MKTTYPCRWKANLKDNRKIIEGRVLTVRGNDYGIVDMSYADVCMGHIFGYLVISNTIFWQCNLCKEWNFRKEIKCGHCNAILDRFKDE